MPCGGEGAAVGAERQAVDADPEGMSAEGGQFLAAGDVPQPHDRVSSGGGEGAAVGAERQVIDTLRVPGERSPLLAAGDVPQPHGLVSSGGGKSAAVGA